MKDEALIREARRAEIEAVWARWGGFIVTPTRVYRPKDVSGLFLEVGGAPVGFITWAESGAEAEVVSLDAFTTGRGFGARLLSALERRLEAAGVARVVLVTTNDNARALRFYIREGYRLVALHLDAMDRVRALKPETPLEGEGGIPLTDMWALEKRL